MRDLEEALKGNGKSTIDSTSPALTSAAQKPDEVMQGEANTQPATKATAQGATDTGHPKKDDVVDDEFKEGKK
jgi:molecular chaperone DnaK